MMKALSVTLTLAALSASVQAMPALLQRDSPAISVDGWLSTSTPAISVDGWLNYQTSVSSLEVTLTTGSETEIVEIFPDTTIIDGTSTMVHLATDTVILGTPLETETAAASSGPTKKQSGAIAGGVVGAVLVAAVLVLILVRFRNKRSSAHWRNRITDGRWNLDQKDESIYTANPMPIPDAIPTTAANFSPLAPLMVRDRHGASVSDAPVSPSSPRGHRRNASSLGSIGGSHNRTESFEMSTSPSSPSFPFHDK
jgi:hypothetical protein